jgi:cell division protein FtsB
VTDSTDGGRSVRGSFRQRFLATGESRFVTIAAFLVVILGISIGGHLYGRFLSARDLGGRDAAIEQLQSEGQKLKRELDDKSAQITALQIKLANAQAALEAIMPSENTYNVNPNQTLIVANGHLTLGLIGSPGNEGVILNVNGKQQTVPAGQVLAVAPDASTKCAVVVQSFDMFKAVVNASCAGVKPQ